MKKKNFVLIILISLICLVPFNVNAANCRQYNTQKACKKDSSCTWKNKKCTENTSKKTTTSKTTSNSTTTSDLKFCQSTASIWQIVGWVLLVFKIVVPILLIIFGVLDLFKAVIGSKDDEIKKSMKAFAMRCISAVVIFFIPTIVGIVMGLITDFTSSGAKSDYDICKNCILTPSECDTSKDVGKQ